MPARPTPDELAVLAAACEADAWWRRADCPACGSTPALHGWLPCRCGGHRTSSCDRTRGGCGHIRYRPERGPGCSDIAVGFSAPPV
jgi:hypothetical protein